MKLTITIIGYNEEEHLTELLPQLDWVDELVYVDCESLDDSLSIAKKHGCLTFSRPNNTNLNVNKSYSFEQASGDWIFYLDPDERIPEKLATEIKELIENQSEHDAFELSRRNHFLGKWLRYGSQFPDKQLRLFRKGKAHFENIHVHEKLRIKGTTGTLQNDMYHFPYVTISQFLKKFDFYTSFEAQHLYKQGVKINWKNHSRFLIIVPFTRFFRRYFIKRGWLDGISGLFCCLFDALNVMVRYFKLWEITRKNEN